MSRYSLTELADLTGIQPRTIRSYIEKGIIPGPERPGRHAYYEDEHLERLRALMALRNLDQLTLDEVRRKLLGLTPDEIKAIAREGFPHAYASQDRGEAGETLEAYIRRAREELSASAAGMAYHTNTALTGNISMMVSGADEKEGIPDKITERAFAKKGNAGGLQPGGRSAFGVTRPMKTGGMQTPRREVVFPPRPSEGDGHVAPRPEPAPPRPTDSGEAIDRLNKRITLSNDASSEAGGFQSSLLKIKELALPRLLERVDPEAAAMRSREELSDELRPIIMEVLAELKVTLNRREQFTLEKALIDECTGRRLAKLLPEEADLPFRPPQMKVETQTRIEVTPDVDLVARGSLSRRQLRILQNIGAELRDRLLGVFDDE